MTVTWDHFPLSKCRGSVEVAGHHPFSPRDHVPVTDIQALSSDTTRPRCSRDIKCLSLQHINYVSGHCILCLQKPTLKISTTLYFRDRISHHPKARSRGNTYWVGANRQSYSKEQFVITSSSFNQTSHTHTYRHTYVRTYVHTLHTYCTSSSNFVCQKLTEDTCLSVPTQSVYTLHCSLKTGTNSVPKQQCCTNFLILFLTIFQHVNTKSMA
jgi:hypothetical protein